MATAPVKKAAPRKAAAATKKAAPRKAVAPKAEAPKLPEFKTPEEAVEFFTKEIAGIGTKLTKAAQNHGLCDTYYTEVANINKTLAVPLSIPKKEVTFQVRFLVTGLKNKTVTSGWDRGNIKLNEGEGARIEKLINAALESEGIKVTFHSNGNGYEAWGE